MIKFRALQADEIDCRVSQFTEKNGECNGAVLLLYMDARACMQILDETVTPERWQREHYECKGNLFCRVGIKCDDSWIWKSDCGVESYAEKEKGESSDSFKRACFNWFGRELYTAPFIWIPHKEGFLKATRDDRTGKFRSYDRFIVDNIEITENGIFKSIVALTIRNEKSGLIVYDWRNTDKEELVGANYIAALRELLNQKGVKESAILKRYKIADIADMTMTDFIQCCNGLNEMEDKA